MEYYTGIEGREFYTGTRYGELLIASNWDREVNPMPWDQEVCLVRDCDWAVCVAEFSINILPYADRYQLSCYKSQ